MLNGRLGERLAAEHGMVPAAPSGAPASVTLPDAGEESDAVAAAAGTGAEDGAEAARQAQEDGVQGFDPAAESAFLAEARERGESVSASPAAASNGEAEEDGGKPLPRLDELINRIPANVRETLDELFRARFVTVKRFPKKALK